jgi:hypothetical protein
LLAHLSPLGWENINLTGDYVWRPEGRVPWNRTRLLLSRSTSDFRFNNLYKYLRFFFTHRRGGACASGSTRANFMFPLWDFPTLGLRPFAFKTGAQYD